MNVLYNIGSSIHGICVEGANRVATMYGESEFDPSSAIESTMEGVTEVGRTIGSHVSGAVEYVRERPYGEAYYHLVQTTGIEDIAMSVASRVFSAVMGVIPAAFSRTNTPPVLLIEDRPPEDRPPAFLAIEDRPPEDRPPAFLAIEDRPSVLLIEDRPEDPLATEDAPIASATSGISKALPTPAAHVPPPLKKMEKLEQVMTIEELTGGEESLAKALDQLMASVIS